MFYADRTNSVTDLLQSWEGEKTNNATGTLSGIVVTSDGGEPIADILVSVGGQLTFTDANGYFFVENLTPGTHNVLFYAIDGKYETFQQGASISAGMNTPAEVAMLPMALINISFQISAPIDALGAPIYMAGNIIQLGNTFSDLGGGMSIKPKRMPKLTPQEDGTYTLDLQLYEKTDLRYKFTLGDGYWNAEQQTSGGFRVRQLIVPDQDLRIDASIDAWRSSGMEPITFNVSMPSETTPYDEKYIQLKSSHWTEPLPLWPVGSGNYLYMLFSPLDTSLPISYRYCRNANCQYAHNSKATADEIQIQPSDVKQTITDTVSSWENWHVLDQPTEVVSANIPWKDESFKTSVELTPQMDPSWQVYAPVGLSEVAKIDANHIIYSPQWFVHFQSPYILPTIGATPFHYELNNLLITSQSLGMATSIFPHLGNTQDIAAWWNSQPHNTDWWEQWFDSYEQFILNYAKLAQISGSSSLILGGKSLLPAISEGIFPDGSPTDAPDSINDRWEDLISNVREVYHGQLIWATNAHISMDPLPTFINEFDEIYISIDSPLTQGQDPTFEEISTNFTGVIDSLIYEIYRSTLKPVTLGFAYPSADGGSQGCYLVAGDCYNDGLFNLEEVSSLPVDLDEQTLIYNAIMPIIASREWITGITIRGYDPTITLLDASSSISGKPALDIVNYWFSGINAE
jgi:hypothetical protein